jgi:Na+/H+-translocating membrane pyrophosphatase
MTSEEKKLADSAAVPVHPIVDFTFADLTALLRRAVRVTVAVGVAVSLALWIWQGWRTAILFAIGAGLSVASIYEWGRLFRHVNARMDGARSSGLGTGLVVALFLFRLTVFALVIYGSLKCFHRADSGSPIALLCGLGLALAGLVWEALRVLRA